MTSFSLAERCVIHPLLQARSAHLAQERITHSKVSVLHRATWEVTQRIWAVSLSIFAAMDACIHLCSGVYKGVCYLNTHKYRVSEIRDHFCQVLWFLSLTGIGSTTGILWPGVVRYYYSSFSQFTAEQISPRLLDLSNKGLTVISPEMGRFGHLQYLILSGNQLHSIPSEIGDLINLKVLLLASNQLTSLPQKIDRLFNLQNLSIHNNRISSLPPGIVNLIHLNQLSLSSNRFTSIPQEIFRNLINLGMLSLEFNQLTSIPREIGALKKLAYLCLDGNPLVDLPPEIGSLSRLQHLFLSNTQLSSLPPEIGLLHNLKRLDLSHNPYLTTLPIEIFDLPATCEIIIEGCPISVAVLERLEEVTTSPNYSGPRIIYSMPGRIETVIGNRPLEELIPAIYNLSRKKLPEQSFCHLTQDVHQSNSLRLWLGRLSDTADFQKGGQTQKNLAQKITGYLEFAEESEDFRKLFFSIIDGATTTCGDRMALSIIDLGLAKRLATLNLNHLGHLADFLIHGPWAIDVLNQLAAKKITTLAFCDPIEVHLGYLVPLAKQLALPLDVEEVLFFRCSRLSQKDLDDAAQHVLTLRKSVDEKSRFLAQHSVWQEALKKHAAEKYTAAMASDDCIHALAQLTKQVMGWY